MSDSPANDVVPLLKALADNARLKIAATLCDRAHTQEELADLLNLPAASVAWHLSLLCEAGLVRTIARPEGDTLYRYQRQPVLDALRAFLPQPSPPALDENPARYDEKVLRDFLVDGRLKHIPVQARKRDVILRFLAQQFVPGQRYPEPEVNRLLGAYHEDYATLRRTMVDTKLLAREDGIYWRVRSGRLI